MITRDEVLTMCGELPGTAEDYPFGDDTAVYKVSGKVFALIPLGGEVGRISLKCDPDRAEGLRAEYPAITAGYHLNKRHWNTIDLDGSVPDDEIAELVEHSYDLVVRGLPKYERERLAALRPQ